MTARRHTLTLPEVEGSPSPSPGVTTLAYEPALPVSVLHLAALIVADRSTSLDDCRELLAMLGLGPTCVHGGSPQCGLCSTRRAAS